MSKITILLPALNEEEAIGNVINLIPKNELEERGYNVEVLVVDGHSKDLTRDIASHKGAKVVLQKKEGKGDGIRTAFSIIDSDYVFMMDADDTYPPIYILKMISMLENGYDIIMGSRMIGYIHEGAMPLLNYLGNRILSFIASVIYEKKVSDVCTGMWGFQGNAISELIPSSNHFKVESELFALSTHNGFKIGEVPIEYRKRKGKSKLHISPLKTLLIGLGIGISMVVKKIQIPHRLNTPLKKI